MAVRVGYGADKVFHQQQIRIPVIRKVRFPGKVNRPDE